MACKYHVVDLVVAIALGMVKGRLRGGYYGVNRGLMGGYYGVNRGLLWG